jgi:putative transcriptional regulator
MAGFGKDLIESAREAVSISEGRVKPAHQRQVDAVDVAALRKRLNLSQDKFAKKFGLSAATVRDWEQGRRYPDSTARILLKVIAQRPEAVVAALKV